MAAVIMVGLIAWSRSCSTSARGSASSGHTVDRRRRRARGRAGAPVDPQAPRAFADDFANKNGGVAGATITINRAPGPERHDHGHQDAPGRRLLREGARHLHGHRARTCDRRWPRSRSSRSASRRSPSTSSHPRALRALGSPVLQRPDDAAARQDGRTGRVRADRPRTATTNGTVGASTLASWIANGYDSYLPLGSLLLRPGAKLNNVEHPGRARRRATAPTCCSRSTTRSTGRARTPSTT